MYKPTESPPSPVTSYEPPPALRPGTEAGDMDALARLIAQMIRRQATITPKE